MTERFITRRQAIRSALAMTLGLGALAGGVGGALAGSVSSGISQETDSLAVLLTPPLVGGVDVNQTINGKLDGQLTLTTQDAGGANDVSHSANIFIQRDLGHTMAFELNADGQALTLVYNFDTSNQFDVGRGNFLLADDLNVATQNGLGQNVLGLNLGNVLASIPLSYPSLPANGIIVGDDGTGVLLPQGVSFGSPFVGLFTNPTTGSIILRSPVLDLSVTPPLVTPPGSPVQVGLPVGAIGATAGLNRPDHRHAFSGRFYLNAYVFDGAEGGTVPVTLQSEVLTNAITIRRITVTALNASVGTDTYDINNGTVGLAVNLTNAKTATATGTINMAAGTTANIRLTARGTTPATRVNISVDYTMNI